MGPAHAPTLLCRYDVPQLAVGGSGDVLAGCTGGLLARMLSVLQQPANILPAHILPAHILAGQAVALHVLAGKSLAGQYPLRGNTPSEVADALPLTLSVYAGELATTCAAPHTATRDLKDDVLPWPR